MDGTPAPRPALLLHIIQMSSHLPFPIILQGRCYFILILQVWKRSWREVKLSDQSPRAGSGRAGFPAQLSGSRDCASATQRGRAWGEAPAGGGQTQSSPSGRPPAAGMAIPGAGPAGLTPSQERPWLPGLAGFPFRPVPRLVRPRDEGHQLSSWAGRGLCKLRGIRGADRQGGRQGAGSLDRHLHFTVPRTEPQACCPLPPWPPCDPALLVSSRSALHSCCFRETLQVLLGHLISAHSKG